MEPALLRAVGAGALGLVTFATGYWLTHSGKPYNGLVFNVHKLLALGAVILFAILLVRAGRASALHPVELLSSGVACLAFVALFATGALLSVDKPMPAIIRTLHHIAPYLAAAAAALALYLFSQGP